MGLPHLPVDAASQPVVSEVRQLVSEVRQRLLKPQYGINESEKCDKGYRPRRRKNEEPRMECVFEPNLCESQRHRERRNE